MPQKRHNKLDGIDSEQISNTIATRGWQLISARVGRALDAKIAELQSSLGPVETAHVRGVIQGLKLALDVPKIMMDEAKENRKNGDSSPRLQSSSGKDW